MASGDTLQIIMPQQAVLPDSSFPSFNIRSNNLILDFDDSTDESCEFAGFMPRNYDGGGVTVTIGWMARTGTINECIWNLAFKSVTDDTDDLDTKAYAAVNTVTATTSSASGEVDYATIVFTDGADMDSIAAGEFFNIQLTRDADNGSDDLSGDAQLVFIEIRET